MCVVLGLYVCGDMCVAVGCEDGWCGTVVPMHVGHTECGIGPSHVRFLVRLLRILKLGYWPPPPTVPPPLKRTRSAAQVYQRLG